MLLAGFPLTRNLTYIQKIKEKNIAVISEIEFAYRFIDKAKVIAITGTNGKTTVASLLHQMFISLGFKTGLLSTVVNKLNKKEIPSTHTTPDPISLNKLLADMVDAQIGLFA